MGIMTRQHGERYVITSDRVEGTAAVKRAPRRSADISLVWTGAAWSTLLEEALGFDSLDAADDYLRQHYAKIMA